MFLTDLRCLFFLKNKKMKIVKIINQNSFLLIIIIFMGAFLRLYGLNWDQGLYLHPDERLYVNASNITLPHSISNFFSPNSPLNPKMFYYGSFPLFLYKVTNVIFLPKFSFLLASRLVSSIISILTIPIIFLIGRQLSSAKTGLIASFVFAFSTGSIQY